MAFNNIYLMPVQYELLWFHQEQQCTILLIQLQLCISCLSQAHFRGFFPSAWNSKTKAFSRTDSSFLTVVEKARSESSWTKDDKVKPFTSSWNYSWISDTSGGGYKRALLHVVTMVTSATALVEEKQGVGSDVTMVMAAGASVDACIVTGGSAGRAGLAIFMGTKALEAQCSLRYSPPFSS